MNEAVQIMTSYLNSENIFISAAEATSALTKWTTKFPDLDAPPDSEVSDMHDVKCYIVGATFKEASALARIVQ